MLVNNKGLTQPKNSVHELPPSRSEEVRTQDHGLFSRGASYLLPVVTAVAIASFLFRENSDPDTWWQVAIGRSIIERGTIPYIDIFSVVGYGRPYHDSHWLFQIFLALADKIYGMLGVNVMMMVIWGVIFLITYKSIRSWLPRSLACPLLFLASLGCNSRFIPRPEIFTFLFIALYYLRLQKGKYRTVPDLVLLGICQVIWTNSHGIFIIGPFLVGCYAACDLYQLIKEKPSGGARTALAAFIVVLAATLVNPHGLDTWRYALQLFTEVGDSAPPLFKNVLELSPTFGPKSIHFFDFWPFLVLLITYLGAVVVAVKEKTLTVQRLLVTAGLLAAAITAMRNIPLFILVAAPFSAEHLRSLLRRYERQQLLPIAAGVIMIVFAWFPLSGTLYAWGNYEIRSGLGPTGTIYPEGFTEFLYRSGFKGQIFNSNTLGGFCLYNGILPMSDGRWEVYDSNNLIDILASLQDTKIWQNMAAQYGITGFLLQHNSYEARVLLPQLANNAGWRLIYYDQAASFWVRTDASNLPPATFANPLKTLSKRHRLEEYRNMADFLSSIGKPEAATRYVSEGLRIFGDRADFLTAMVRMELAARHDLEAEATTKKLFNKYPEDPNALYYQAYFSLKHGNRAAAAEYLAKAVKSRPDDKALREYYQEVVGDRGGNIVD